MRIPIVEIVITDVRIKRHPKKKKDGGWDGK